MPKKIWMTKKTFKCLTCGIVEEFSAKEIMPHLKQEHNIGNGDAYERTLNCALDGTGFHALTFLLDFKEKKCQVQMYQQEALEKEDDVHELQQNGWLIKKSN